MGPDFMGGVANIVPFLLLIRAVRVMCTSYFMLLFRVPAGAMGVVFYNFEI